jgi:hypothetical protein
MTTTLAKIIPPPTAIVREGVIVLGGLLLAAFVLSRFPRLRDWVTAQSITVTDPNKNILY